MVLVLVTGTVTVLVPLTTTVEVTRGAQISNVSVAIDRHRCHTRAGRGNDRDRLGDTVMRLGWLYRAFAGSRGGLLPGRRR